MDNHLSLGLFGIDFKTDSRIVNILTPSAYEMKVIKAPLYAQIYEKKTEQRQKEKAKILYSHIIVLSLL